MTLAEQASDPQGPYWYFYSNEQLPDGKPGRRVRHCFAANGQEFTEHQLKFFLQMAFPYLLFTDFSCEKLKHRPAHTKQPEAHYFVPSARDQWLSRNFGVFTNGSNSNRPQPEHRYVADWLRRRRATLHR